VGNDASRLVLYDRASLSFRWVHLKERAGEPRRGPTRGREEVDVCCAWAGSFGEAPRRSTACRMRIEGQSQNSGWATGSALAGSTSVSGPTVRQGGFAASRTRRSAPFVSRCTMPAVTAVCHHPCAVGDRGIRRVSRMHQRRVPHFCAIDGCARWAQN
jgi:hypothetical protein